MSLGCRLLSWFQGRALAKPDADGVYRGPIEIRNCTFDGSDGRFPKAAIIILRTEDSRHG